MRTNLFSPVRITLKRILSRSCAIIAGASSASLQGGTGACIFMNRRRVNRATCAYFDVVRSTGDYASTHDSLLSLAIEPSMDARLQRLVDFIRRDWLSVLDAIYQIVQLGSAVHVVNQKRTFTVGPRHFLETCSRCVSSCVTTAAC